MTSLVRKRQRKPREPGARVYKWRRASSTNHSLSNLQTSRFGNPVWSTKCKSALYLLNPYFCQSFNRIAIPCVRIRSLVQKFHPREKISRRTTMTFQRCAIVVGILVCYSLSSLEAAINCERLVFHPDCRGSQTKRSSLPSDETNYINAQTLEDLFEMTDSSRKSSHPSRSRNSINNNYEKSRLWTALLDRGLNPEAMYDWYLAHLQEKSAADANRQNWIQENYPGRNVIDGDY